jgi:hypothetical protein
MYLNGADISPFVTRPDLLVWNTWTQDYCCYFF